MRSEKYPTRYRVGSVGGRAVYWHPQEGYAVKHDFAYLMPITDLSQIEWFDKPGDLDKIVGDLGISNDELGTALLGDLYDHILDSLQDAAFADEAEKEKEATLRQESGVY